MYCHKKTRPPIFGSPRSKFIEIFGPPDNFIEIFGPPHNFAEIFGPPEQKFLKYLDLLEIFYPPIILEPEG